MAYEYPTFDFDQVDYVTSDTHFSYARISELADRPFASAAEMDAELVRRWNDTVGHDDVVLHLGDVAFGTDRRVDTADCVAERPEVPRPGQP